MEPKVEQFLRDLQVMIAEKRDNGWMEYLAPWSQVPEKYQDDFLAWSAEVKQQTWPGIEETGWMSYAYEYLADLITKFIEENHEQEKDQGTDTAGNAGQDVGENPVHRTNSVISRITGKGK